MQVYYLVTAEVPDMETALDVKDALLDTLIPLTDSGSVRMAEGE